MKITVHVDDRDDADEFGCEYMFTKELHDLQGLMYFYGQVTRGIGFGYVEKVGCIKAGTSTEPEEEVWSEF